MLRNTHDKIIFTVTDPVEPREVVALARKRPGTSPSGHNLHYNRRKHVEP